MGQYTQVDPIGLTGGNPALYGYVFNPFIEIDPFGLRCKNEPYNGVSRSDAFNQAKRDAGVPRSQQPSRVTREPLLDQNGNKIIQDGRVVETRNYHFINNNGQSVIIQEHSWGHVVGNQPPHFNVRPPSNPNTGHFPGTHGHYYFPGTIRQ